MIFLAFEERLVQNADYDDAGYSAYLELAG
jgi:hypothetical protein